MTAAARAALLGAVALLGGCESVGYLLHAAGGQYELLSQRREIDAVIADPATPPALRARLEQVREMRRFAVDALALPAGGSYRDYVDIGRDFVVYSVIAAPELSLEPKRWCYPVVGCLSYRGYYDLARANVEARRLHERGLDVYVAPVRAYSTLGWFDDPVLNTLMRMPSWALAGVLFHELAHARLYVPGDTAFNESYAVAVELEGERRWIEARGDGEARLARRRAGERRAAFLALACESRTELAEAYASAASDEEKRRRKHALLRSLRARYAELRRSWGGWRGYDRWFAQNLNNAKLALVGTYHDLVPGFRALLARNGGDFAAFHEAVAHLAELDPAARRSALSDFRTPSGAPRAAGADAPC